MSHYLLAIDQGTTSSRAIVFSAQGLPVASCQQEFKQYFPKDGWVEHDGEEIWLTTLQVCRDALARKGLRAADIAAIGITNQRETTLVWDAASGDLIHPAIVWQDRRTADYCAELKAAGHEANVSARTGLLIDPYFSATKLRWILDNVPGARQRAERGELRFGTVDCFLLWRLTGGRSHRTDATNASRTLLFNIHSQDWDEELLALFEIPRSLLPEVLDCAAEFGVSEPSLLGAAIPVLGMAGDQQAALIGQACFQPGMVKSTYGTGCFMIQNTGEQPVTSKNRLLTTVGYRLDGKVSYAVEGSIFVAGAAVQWLRDGIKLIDHAHESEALAIQAGDSNGVYLVPAFTGLGAPYWDPEGARRDLRPDPRHRNQGDRHRRSAIGLLPDPRPARSDAPGRHAAQRAAGGRRDGGEQLGDAIPHRHPWRHRGAPGSHRDHRPRRGLHGRAEGRLLS